MWGSVWVPKGPFQDPSIKVSARDATHPPQKNTIILSPSIITFTKCPPPLDFSRKCRPLSVSLSFVRSTGIGTHPPFSKGIFPSKISLPYPYIPASLLLSSSPLSLNLLLHVSNIIRDHPPPRRTSFQRFQRSSCIKLHIATHRRFPLFSSCGFHAGK